MNKKLSTILAAGALVVGAQQAMAVTVNTYADADNYNPSGTLAGGVTILPGDQFTSNFNLKSNGDADGTTFKVKSGGAFYTGPTANQTFNSSLGFVPGTDTVVSGSGWMGFWFRVGQNASYSAIIEDITLGGNGTTSLTSNVLLQNGLSLQIEAVLNQFGDVNYHVINTTDPDNVFGAVKLDYAYLQIDAERQDIPTTPDGGATAVLFGLGALGMAAVRRKMS